MSNRAMRLRRWKFNTHQELKYERQRNRRWHSFRPYGVSYGFPQVIHNGGKP